MLRYNHYTRQQLEDIMDNLREDGCPEDFLQETAHMMLNETLTEGLSNRPFLIEDNPFWEPIEQDDDPLDTEAQIGYPYNPELGAFTRCSFA